MIGVTVKLRVTAETLASFFQVCVQIAHMGLLYNLSRDRLGSGVKWCTAQSKPLQPPPHALARM